MRRSERMGPFSAGLSVRLTSYLYPFILYLKRFRGRLMNPSSRPVPLGVDSHDRTNLHLSPFDNWRSLPPPIYLFLPSTFPRIDHHPRDQCEQTDHNPQLAETNPDTKVQISHRLNMGARDRSDRRYRPRICPPAGCEEVQRDHSRATCCGP